MGIYSYLTQSSKCQCQQRMLSAFIAIDRIPKQRSLGSPPAAAGYSFPLNASLKDTHQQKQLQSFNKSINQLNQSTVYTCSYYGYNVECQSYCFMWGDKSERASIWNPAHVCIMHAYTRELCEFQTLISLSQQNVTETCCL